MVLILPRAHDRSITIYRVIPLNMHNILDVLVLHTYISDDSRFKTIIIKMSVNTEITYNINIVARICESY